ncbi:MAG: hypothetical protein ACYTDY_00535 [Planctomycetota bacterium]|jgi:hypothetical protein
MGARGTLTVAVLLLLASVVAADTIYLKRGSTLEGKVLDLEEDAVILTLDGVKGSRVVVPLSQVSDYGVYELRRSRIEDSVAGHEKLGDWALKKGLFGFAMWEYRAALDLAGDGAEKGLREKLTVASHSCGRDKLERGTALVSEGRLLDARDFFRDIVKNHPTCPAAKEAKKRITELTSCASWASTGREAWGRRRTPSSRRSRRTGRPGRRWTGCSTSPGSRST